MKKIAMGTKIVRYSLIGSIWLSLLANFTSKLYLYQIFYYIHFKSLAILPNHEGAKLFILIIHIESVTWTPRVHE